VETKKRIGVLCHGRHLQTKNWEKLMWGIPPDLLGQLPKTVLVALEEKAEVIVFGTGASERDGKKEAEFIRDYLLEHFFELAEFPSFQGIDLEKARKRIERISMLELYSQNTAEEVRFAGQIFKKAGMERIILVSSFTHISRCLRDAYVAFSRDENLKHFTKNLWATPSQTGWADASEVVIIEPPHRGDKPVRNFILFLLNALFKRIYQFPKAVQSK